MTFLKPWAKEYGFNAGNILLTNRVNLRICGIKDKNVCSIRLKGEVYDDRDT